MPDAARILDLVEHALPPGLTPGPGSPDVMIGFKPAWRGLPSSAASGLQAAKDASDKTIEVAEKATQAASGTPGYGAAKTAEETTKATAATTMGTTISAAASSSGADKHACTKPLPTPPHGPGVVIDGSKTVFINFLPACRKGDHVLEAVGPPNEIKMGEPTVIIGDDGDGSASPPSPPKSSEDIKGEPESSPEAGEGEGSGDSPGGGGGSGAGGAGAPVTTTGGQEETTTHFLEIELIDEEGNPIPGEKYEVTTPDGKVRKGKLDGEGFARLDNLKQGSCQIKFPGLSPGGGAPGGGAGGSPAGGSGGSSGGAAPEGSSPPPKSANAPPSKPQSTAQQKKFDLDAFVKAFNSHDHSAGAGTAGVIMAPMAKMTDPMLPIHASTFYSIHWHFSEGRKSTTSPPSPAITEEQIKNSDGSFNPEAFIKLYNQHTHHDAATSKSTGPPIAPLDIKKFMK